MTQMRQGDVLLRAVDALPEGARAVRPEDRIVLATGERTGHAHRVTGGAATLYEADGARYLVVDAPARLEHEEHDALAVPPGVYEVVRQREYRPERPVTRFD